MKPLRIGIITSCALLLCASDVLSQEILITESLPEYTGVSSDGAQFMVDLEADLPTQIASSEGSGEEDMNAFTDSDEDYQRLLMLPAITPSGIGIEPEVIIGSDDRKKVTNTVAYPFRAQVLIELPGGRCSGAMISKDTVITAGHCVHSGGSGGSWRRWARVYPGKNGQSSPFGVCSATRLYSVVGWTQNKNPNYDFGAIKLNCDVGNRTGWMGFWWQSASLVNTGATITSYPGDKPLEQWGHTDKVRANSGLRTYYQTDTVGGNSGSGVFTNRNNCGPCIHTVHAYGSSSNNSGTRITKPLFANLMRWRSEP